MPPERDQDTGGFTGDGAPPPSNAVGGGTADSMREFEDAIKEATKALGGDGGGTGGGGKGGGGGGLIGAAKKAGLFAAVMKAGTDLGGGFGATGSLETGVGSAKRGLIDLAAMTPVGAVLGLTSASKTLGAAEARTGGFLGQAAALGMEITDEQIQADLDITIAQEKRRTELEARVKGISGSEENVAKATPDVLDSILKVLEDISNFVTSFGGGSSR